MEFARGPPCLSLYSCDPPAGLVSERAMMSESTFTIEHATRFSRVGMSILAVLMIALATAPYWADRGDLRLLSEIFAYMALASLWNLLAGYAGLVSVGQQ